MAAMEKSMAKAFGLAASWSICAVTSGGSSAVGGDRWSEPQRSGRLRGRMP
jgi:hypothetical protein